MTYFKKTVQMLAAAWLLAGPAWGLTPTELKVEYRKSPLNIDTPAPRFAWQLRDDRRGAGETAWQVRVRSAAGPVWDSGKSQSRHFVNVPYAGPALASRTRYFWTVEVWDRDGKPVKSEEATFVTGVLRPGDWRARWIWEDREVQPDDYAYFHKSFELAGPPAEAIALVSAHNFYELYVNGRLVSGLINPATSNPHVHKYYLAYDLTPLLKAGRNDIAAVCQYKGAGGQNYINGVPGFLFDALVTLADGSSLRIATGEDWKTLAETAWDASAPYTNARKHTLTEYYDARREPAGWPGALEDMGWKNAAAVEPGYPLRAQGLPESVVQETLTATKMWRTWTGSYVYDFGREYGGTELLRVSGRAGDEITIRFSDRLNLFRRVAHSTGHQPTRTNFDRFTLAGKGVEVWQPRFGYRGFRYLEVSGFPGKPTLESVQAAYVRTPLPRTGSFSCSNPLINRIYEMSMHTLEIGHIGQLIDCVHREQSQWHADAEMQSEAILLNFDGHQMLKKTLLDLAAGQNPDGSLPSNYPAEKDFAYYIPEWDMHYLPMLVRVFRYSDDRELLTETWPAVEKLIEFYLKSVDDTGLIVKTDVWHISDWPPDYERIDDSGKYLTVENCLFYQTLSLGALVAEMTGHPQQTKRWEAAAGRMKNAINQRLYDAAAGSYLDSLGSKFHHPGVSALALFVDVVPGEREEQILAYITKPEKIFASVYLTYFAIPTLYDHGRGDHVMKLINREDFPGWGYMLKKGDGTTWEGWRFPSSKAHPFNAYLAGTFINKVVGIQPAAGNVFINPHLDGLEWAKGSVQTTAGPVSANWKREGGGLVLELELPAGLMAGIRVPGQGVKTITEGNDPLYPRNARGEGCMAAPGGTFVESRDFIERFTAGPLECMEDSAGLLIFAESGRYSFRIGY